MSLGLVSRKCRTFASRAFSSERISMLVGADNAQIKCVCVVDSNLAEFQLDCGSTFTQIQPDLAPRQVPRHGLGSASCLGRRLWFPTCEVALAPVDTNGQAIDVQSSGTPSTRVQVGSSNLLGLNELRRWRMQMDFTQNSQSCSVVKEDETRVETSQAECVVDTIPLEDALRAASILSEGTISPEEALCRDRPWLIDAGLVLLAHQERIEKAAYESTSWISAGFPELRDSLIPWSRPRHRSDLDPGLHTFGFSAALPMSSGVLFGTADALVSHTEIPPLLPPPPWLT